MHESFLIGASGSGLGVVILRGDDTVMGRIAYLTSGITTGSTPIAREIEHFIHIVTGITMNVGKM